MTTLRKTVVVTYWPDDPGVPDDPGSPARPGYCTGKYLAGGGGGGGSGGGSVTIVFAPGKTIPWPAGLDPGKSHVITVPLGPPSFSPGGIPECFPARPARPPKKGRPQTAAKFVRDFNLGWNSGAISKAVCLGDCELSFTVPASAIGVVCGLNGGNEGVGYKEIDHGLYCSKGVATIRENESVGRSIGYSSGTVLSITRAGGAVSYAKDGEVFHISLKGSSGAVFADASLYSGGDAIIAAKLTDLGDPPDASGITVVGTSSSSLKPLAGHSSRGEYAGGSGSLEPLSAASESGELRPDYALGLGYLSVLVGASWGPTGEVGVANVSLSPIASLGADRPYASAFASIHPISGYSAPVFEVEGMIQAEMRGHYRVRSSATQQHRNQINARMPMARAQSAAGAQLRAKMPSAFTSGAGTVAVVANITARMGSPSAVFSATTGAVSKLAAALTGHFAGSASSGAALAARLTKRYQLTAAGLTGATGKISARMPSCQVSMGAHQEEAQRITARMPRLRRSASARITARMAPCRAYARTTSVTPRVYEAYSINLSHVPKPGVDPIDEVTRYSNFPFDRIVRYQGSYFGVAADGLYLLEGTTDDGTAIPYAVKTCIDDFKAPELKTVASAYFSGRLGPDATVTLHAGEQGQESYPYNTPRGQGAQNHREKFGRGVKNRYFAIGVAGDGALELDTIELEVNKMSRRI